MSDKSKPAALVVTFRPDFCSPAYVNGLLRLQHLHWLEIHRRASDGAVTDFLFVIPASLANLVCVLGTEVPFLEAEIGCQVHQIPVPEFVAPDGLKAFSVHYAPERAPGQAHGKFLTALRGVCVRLQLTNICVDPAPVDGEGRAGVGADCAACAKLSTHTKSVRGANNARPRRRPPLMLDLARTRTRRPASVEAAAGDAVTKKAAAAEVMAASAAAAAQAAVAATAEAEKLADAAAASLLGRLPLAEAAIDAAALVATAASATLGVCSGLDLRLVCSVADSLVARQRIRIEVVGIFADWAAELSGRLLAGCARLAADGVATAVVAAASVADAAAGRLLDGLVDKVTAELSVSGRTTVQVGLPCDWRTSRSLLGLQPLRRRCSNCGASVTAVPMGSTGYRLTVRSSSGRGCSRHASLLQLADCARSSKDAKLGGLLLQEVASLPGRP